MNNFKGGTAVITGAASGFGLEVSRIAAGLGMNVVMADVQQEALTKAAAEISALGVQVLPYRLDISKAAEVEALGAATFAKFGAPNFVFNNAGVGGGGLIWESSLKDWDWVLGVNLMGVVHGVRVFTPMMLEAAKKDPSWRGHITNTASMAGLVAAPNMGVYTVSKHAVVALSETLYQDLSLVTDQVHASVLCPYFVPTGIADSARNRPAELSDNAPMTKSQLIGRAMASKAVTSGKVGHHHRRVGVRGHPQRDLLHLQPPPGAGRGAGAPGRRAPRPQPERPVRRPPREGRRTAQGAARGLT